MSCLFSTAIVEAKENTPLCLNVEVYHFGSLVRVNPRTGRCSGLEVELLKRFAKQSGSEITFTPTKSFVEIFDGLQEGRASIAVAGISVTAEREELIDFSHPTLNSGLSLLVRSEQPSYYETLRIWGRAVLPTVLFLLIFTLFSAHLVWWAERGESDFSDSYRKGIWDALWYVFVLIVSVGFAEKFTKRALGRVITGSIMLIWFLLGANLVSDLSVAKIARMERPEILDLSSLVGEPMATVEGTTSEKEISLLGGTLVSVGKIDDAIKLLEKGDVKAVLFDTPVLKKYDQNRGRLSIISELKREDYAVAFPVGSLLREEFNRFLLSIKESGEYEALLVRYLPE